MTVIDRYTCICFSAILLVVLYNCIASFQPLMAVLSYCCSFNKYLTLRSFSAKNKHINSCLVDSTICFKMH